MARKKRGGLCVGAIVVLASTLVLSGCGDKFTSACKTAINNTIDLRQLAYQLSGGVDASCSLYTDDAGADLAAACASLEASSASLQGTCGDAFSEANYAVLGMEKQY